MGFNKPKKITYKNQDEVHDKIIKFLTLKLKGIPCEAYLVGSATEKKFGKYVEKHGVHEGSDIDLVVLVDKEDIPDDWREIKAEGKWWQGYKVGKIKINGITHRAEALVIKEGMEDYAHERMKKLGWKPEKVK